MIESVFHFHNVGAGNYATERPIFSLYKGGFRFGRTCGELLSKALIIFFTALLDLPSGSPCPLLEPMPPFGGRPFMSMGPSDVEVCNGGFFGAAIFVPILISEKTALPFRSSVDMLFRSVSRSSLFGMSEISSACSLGGVLSGRI